MKEPTSIPPSTLSKTVREVYWKNHAQGMLRFKREDYAKKFAENEVYAFLEMKEINENIRPGFEVLVNSLSDGQLELVSESLRKQPLWGLGFEPPKNAVEIKKIIFDSLDAYPYVVNSYLIRITTVIKKNFKVTLAEIAEIPVIPPFPEDFFIKIGPENTEIIAHMLQENGLGLDSILSPENSLKSIEYRYNLSSDVMINIVHKFQEAYEANTQAFNPREVIICEPLATTYLLTNTPREQTVAPLVKGVGKSFFKSKIFVSSLIGVFIIFLIIAIVLTLLFTNSLG